MTAASIAKDLRAAIRSGTYTPGDRLPSEAALMATYGVARMTARHGLSMLKDEGLTVTRHGSGVFVRAFEPIIRDTTGAPADDSTVTAEIDETGAGLTVRTLAVTAEADAPEKVRTALGLAEGDKVTVRERLHLRERKPVLFATSYLPASIAAGTPIAERDVGQGGTHARLADAGHAPVRFREDVVARMPSIEEIEELRIEPGTPVLAVTRTAFAADGTPVELSHVVLDAGEFMLRYDID
ncbi:GntR family transcriptional regulator [Promicromonospora citrea]|uniref:GntR family transcriptional regulator n=1 Tax=Promicromonospora citrea TaxID=43677 RepID=A0A8H9GL73_9MICO|nr:GntR family transcriptional regulator [Promicromonospora citrea]GGM36055.1 GntR family transcriptional regulator [Promicromonospora citrea]